MDCILEYVLFSNPDDEPRLCEIINEWISDEEVPAFTKFTKEPKAKKMRRKLKVIHSHQSVLLSLHCKLYLIEKFSSMKKKLKRRRKLLKKEKLTIQTMKMT